MSQPWMKWYPSDWRADQAVRMCSLGARGLWIEILCVMHEADGSLVINGRALTVRQIATLAGSSVSEIEPLLIELEDAGVFSRDPDQTIFSRRIRRDIAKAARDRENGKGGGNPALTGRDNPPNKPKPKAEDKAQIPEARNQNPEITPPSSFEAARLEKEGREFFEKVWEGFPKDKAASKSKADAAFSELTHAEKAVFAGNITAVAAHVREQKLPHPHNLATFIKDRKFAGFTSVKREVSKKFRFHRDSPQGQAHEAHRRKLTGIGVPWTDDHWEFDTEWPPGHERSLGAG